MVLEINTQIGSAETKAPVAGPKYIKGLEELLKEMKGKSLIIIIEEGIAYEARLNRENNKLTIEYKQIREDNLKEFTREKKEIYQRTHGIWMGAISAAGSIAVAFVPAFGAAQGTAQAVQAGWQAINIGIQKADERFTNADQSAHAQVDYLTNNSRDSKSEHTQGMMQNNQFYKELEGINDKNRSFLSELFRTLYAT